MTYHQILRTNPENILQQRTPDIPEKEKNSVLYYLRSAKVKNVPDFILLWKVNENNAYIRFEWTNKGSYF